MTNLDQSWLLTSISLFLIIPGDSIFSAGKPALLANNTLIRTTRQLTNNRRHVNGTNNLTSSSSTISSVSNNNNDRDKEYKELIKDKDKEMYDNPQHRYLLNTGKSDPFLFININFSSLLMFLQEKLRINYYNSPFFDKRKMKLTGSSFFKCYTTWYLFTNNMVSLKHVRLNRYNYTGKSKVNKFS